MYNVTRVRLVGGPLNGEIRSVDPDIREFRFILPRPEDDEGRGAIAPRLALYQRGQLPGVLMFVKTVL